MVLGDYLKHICFMHAPQLHNILPIPSSATMMKFSPLDFLGVSHRIL